MTLRSSLTYRVGPNQFIEPSITYGLNEDANDTLLSISNNRRL